MIDVVTIETPSLGDRSYLLIAGNVAVAVDPQRDIDRVQRIVDERGLTLTHVLETHVHNDYVSGGLELARSNGCDYVVAAAEPVGYERIPVAEGDEIVAGRMRVRVVHTPGHTPHHVAYFVAEGDWMDEEQAGPALVLSGGSLLYGTVGRTDLIAAQRTEELTRAQYRSARRLLREFPADARVLPTHGFGSFCSATSPDTTSDGTIAGERDVNQVAQTDDEDQFVATIAAGLTAFPRYYRHMGPVNREGPAPVDLSAPAPSDLRDIRRRVAAGEWAVDVRERRSFAAAHVPGTVNIGLDGPFATYLGWLVPWGTPVTLLAAEAARVTEAHREMVRIGIDKPAGRLAGVPGALVNQEELESYDVADFAALARHRRDTCEPALILDVRRDDEWRDGHIEGAVHVPLPDLDQRLAEVPAGPLWVHCASGFRASIAASLLARAGRDVVLVDDDFPSAARAGLDITND